MRRYSYTPGAKPINVNSGSGSTLARKAGTKYSKRLNNYTGNFSLNGTSNHNYTGNPNSKLSYIGCKLPDTSIKISVKNYSGLRGTRITNSDINDGFKCNPVNSYQSYIAINNDFRLNKYDLYNKACSEYINIKKTSCGVDRSNYIIDILNYTGTNNCSLGKTKTNTNTNTLTKNCNVTKDINQIFGYTSNYDLYINEKVKKGCSYNPRDARLIAC